MGPYSRDEQQIYNDLKQSLMSNSDLMYAGSLLKRAFLKYPHNLALIAPDRSVTYREWYFRSLLASKYLRQQGIQKRDRVLLYFENSPEFYVAYMAIWNLGAIVVPINIFLHERELIHILNDSKSTALIASATLRPNLDALVTNHSVTHMPKVLSQEIFDWDTPVADTFEHLEQEVDVQELDPHELSALLYTSGTTGIPRGVMLSSTNVMTNALQGYARFMSYGLTDQDRFFCVLPLFHVFAQNTCFWLPLMIGASIIIVTKIDRKLILEGLEKRPTVFFGFPALYGLLCLMRNAPLGSVKMFVSGADMLPDKIRLGFALIYGRNICAGYGLSEAAPVVAVNHQAQTRATHVVGYPLHGIQCQIRDDAGSQLPAGHVGTLWIKGGNIMMGYYNDPESTTKVLVDGWLNTGDLAVLDKQGVLAITGRVKDVIIHKGFNIYPAEVENILMTHPAVFKAAVIGQEEPMSGQIPVAYLAVRTKDLKLESDLKALCSHNLAAYKIPRKFICLDDLPMNATGKVDKKKLTQSPLN